MCKFHIVCIIVLCSPAYLSGAGQDVSPPQQDTCTAEAVPAQTFRFSGQLSGFVQYAPDLQLNFSAGGRYIPQANYKIPLRSNRLIDFEASLNLNGEMDFHPFDSTQFGHGIKGYRFWGRYSTNRMELRVGLQKINFGSALMLRPLMWFDRIDPRDPLQITDGVTGLLWRYYFLNNANIWVWGLYGNNKTKGYEITSIDKRYPEVGGRIQWPIPAGEVALSYHYRVADLGKLFTAEYQLQYPQVGEHKVGFDLKVNIEVGLWVEASFTRFNRSFGLYTNQEMITAGADYTLNIGNGITAAFEHFVYSGDQKAFEFINPTYFSALSLSYPINVFNNIRVMTFYNWKDNKGFLFLTWLKQFNRLSFYVMGYWNPQTFSLPGQSAIGNRFAGKGAQVMVVWNH